MDWTRDGCMVSDDPGRLDWEALLGLLAGTAWAADRPRALTERAVARSAWVGLYARAGAGWRQVGFARAVTDEATFAWLCDVVVHPDYRGRGLGRWMVGCLLEHPRLQTLSQYLRTETASGLYESLGFQRVEVLRRSRRDGGPQGSATTR
ncbi:MAG: hypothetical protein RJA22_2702 [Verrucomicrobiota bacterium]|jgi:GNAT superfamily N-acetyltransferase